jgi:four helix bundle protein
MNPAPLTHRELDVYKRALACAIEIIHASNRFPPSEKYELTAQIRASSRSVCACIAEAWRKRGYPAAFVSKITDSESEAAETQTWIEIALAHGYLTKEEGDAAIAKYEHVLAQLVRVKQTAPKWKGKARKAR